MMNRARVSLFVYAVAAAGPVAWAASDSPATVPTTSLQAPASTAAPSPIPVVQTTGPTTYSTVKGDTFGSVAKKFGCSIRSLKKLNKIKSTHLKPGTSLEIPVAVTSRHALKKGSATLTAASKPAPVLSAKEQRRLALAAALKATDKYRRHAPVAQPVQDFDIPPSAFASCPTPPSNGTEQNIAASSDEGTTAPVPPSDIPPGPGEATSDLPAPLVANNSRGGLLPVPASLPAPPPAPVIEPATPSSFSADHSGLASTPSTGPATAPVLDTTPPKKTLASAIVNFFGGSHNEAESGEWGNRFLVETRNLAAQGVCYDGSWRPDGESHRWEMDCSNTSRYLYQVTAGIQLPRTASDQYYYLHLQDKAWDVPMTVKGFADCNFLRANLKPGDLLFWENTYRPERQPPITHVMIFLGSDARGRWLMAGSQGSRGFYNPRHSGPDVYVFNPTHAVGGYTTWLGLVRHHGRFVAYGRPLEADVKKLSVAANE